MCHVNWEHRHRKSAVTDCASHKFRSGGAFESRDVSFAATVARQWPSRSGDRSDVIRNSGDSDGWPVLCRSPKVVLSVPVADRRERLPWRHRRFGRTSFQPWQPTNCTGMLHKALFETSTSHSRGRTDDSGKNGNLRLTSGAVPDDMSPSQCFLSATVSVIVKRIRYADRQVCQRKSHS